MSIFYHAEHRISIAMPSVIIQNVIILIVVTPCHSLRFCDGGSSTLIPRLSFFPALQKDYAFAYDVNELDEYGNPNVHSRTEVREGPHVKGKSACPF
jgi:hypothetical protein